MHNVFEGTPKLTIEVKSVRASGNLNDTIATSDQELIRKLVEVSRRNASLWRIDNKLLIFYYLDEIFGLRMISGLSRNNLKLSKSFGEIKSAIFEPERFY
jgi:hypothetical protein